MTDEHLRKDYERIIENSRQRGELDSNPAGAERRRHPRIKVNPGLLPVDIDPWVFAIDVSISGMAFYSDEPVEIGEVVNIILGDMMSVEASVLNAYMEEPPSPYQPKRYRLNCKFSNEDEGVDLLVKIKEMEELGKPV